MVQWSFFLIEPPEAKTMGAIAQNESPEAKTMGAIVQKGQNHVSYRLNEASHVFFLELLH